jgi:solute carrier family 25 (adenine nucleotide translocator) protein 4/5/6/31
MKMIYLYFYTLGRPNRAGGPSPVATLAIGCASGVVAASVFAPVDRVKLLLQCQHEITRSGRLHERYRGIINCTRQIYRTEGIRAFWRGNVVACVKYIPEQMIKYALKDKMAEMMKVSRQESVYTRMVKNIGAGAIGSFSSLVVIYPLGFCRTRLAADVLSSGKVNTGTRQFEGTIDVFRKTLSSDGVVGLYRGFMVSCLGIVVYRGLYLGLYDTLAPMVVHYDGSSRMLAAFLLGYGVTAAAGVISYPLDTIVRRMMMRSCESVKYTGWIDCARFAIRNNGFFSLYNGVLVSLFKGFAGVPLMIGYDMMKVRYSRNRS